MYYESSPNTAFVKKDHSCRVDSIINPTFLTVANLGIAQRGWSGMNRGIYIHTTPCMGRHWIDNSTIALLPFIVTPKPMTSSSSDSSDSSMDFPPPSSHPGTLHYIPPNLCAFEPYKPVAGGANLNTLLWIGGMYDTCLLYTSPSPRDS